VQARFEEKEGERGGSRAGREYALNLLSFEEKPMGEKKEDSKKRLTKRKNE